MPKVFEAPPGFVLNPDYLVPELRAQRDALLEALKLASAWVEEYISQMRAYTISEQADDDLSVIYAAIKAVEGGA